MAVNATNGFDYPTYNVAPFGTEGTSQPYSFHSGGVNALFGDGVGAVHPVVGECRDVRRARVTRNGGEILANDF